MKKELVAVKINQAWDIIFNISLSEGKNLETSESVINVIKTNYEELSNCEFIIDTNEIFVLTETMRQINPGTACKI